MTCFFIFLLGFTHWLPQHGTFHEFYDKIHIKWSQSWSVFE